MAENPVADVKDLFRGLNAFIKKTSSIFNIAVRYRKNEDWSSLLPRGINTLQGPAETWFDWPDLAVNFPWPTSLLCVLRSRGVSCNLVTTSRMSFVDFASLPTDTQVFQSHSFDLAFSICAKSLVPDKDYNISNKSDD